MREQSLPDCSICRKSRWRFVTRRHRRIPYRSWKVIQMVVNSNCNTQARYCQEKIVATKSKRGSSWKDLRSRRTQEKSRRIRSWDGRQMERWNSRLACVVSEVYSKISKKSSRWGIKYWRTRRRRCWSSWRELWSTNKARMGGIRCLQPIWRGPCWNWDSTRSYRSSWLRLAYDVGRRECPSRWLLAIQRALNNWMSLTTLLLKLN